MGHFGRKDLNVNILLMTNSFSQNNNVILTKTSNMFKSLINSVIIYLPWLISFLSPFFHFYKGGDINAEVAPLKVVRYHSYYLFGSLTFFVRDIKGKA